MSICYQHPTNYMSQIFKCNGNISQTNGTTTLINGNSTNNNGNDSQDDALINKKLPKELLLRIFSFLDVVSLCRCAQVSKVSNQTCVRLVCRATFYHHHNFLPSFPTKSPDRIQNTLTLVYTWQSYTCTPFQSSKHAR